MFVITGATGNIGRAIAAGLLSQGYSVRALGRDDVKLQPLIDRGAEPMVGAPDDREFMREAFAGAAAVFTMIPPQATADDVRAGQAAIGEAIAAAVEVHQVGHVVNLSAQGAELSEGTGPVLGMHDQERRLDAITGLNVIHLRPAYFMENLLAAVGMIQRMRMYGSSIRADVAFPMVATADIAAVAVERLIARDFAGSSTQLLLGPADWTMADATRVIGGAIGHPNLPYVQLPYEQAAEAMLGLGLSPDGARAIVELTRAINEQRGVAPLARDERSSTPTTLEQFVSDVLVPAFAARAA
ncbi:MAG: NAD(P)H-binding protein [Myxococcales bacterium]|nr:NAD(P)H-binding protein [Myxococcales bacterium]